MDAAPNPNPPLETILVATDFSKPAAVAFAWGVELAQRHGCELVVVHAAPAPDTLTDPDGSRRVVTGHLAELVEPATAAGVDARSEIGVGRTWEVIGAAEATARADLIVLGLRGHTRFATLRIGSTADRVVRTARVPVLAVHDDEEEAPRLRTVLVATDFSEAAGAARQAACRLMDHGGEPAKVVLLHAWQPLIDYGVDGAGAILVSPLEDTEAESRAALERIAEPMRAAGRDVDVRVRQGYPSLVIEKEAEAVGADLIALGTHGRTGLPRLLMGSVAERVLHHAPCAVLTVRQSEAYGDEELA